MIESQDLSWGNTKIPPKEFLALIPSLLMGSSMMEAVPANAVAMVPMSLLSIDVDLCLKVNKIEEIAAYMQ